MTEYDKLKLDNSKDVDALNNVKAYIKKISKKKELSTATIRNNVKVHGTKDMVDEIISKSSTNRYF